MEIGVSERYLSDDFVNQCLVATKEGVGYVIAIHQLDESGKRLAIIGDIIRPAHPSDPLIQPGQFERTVGSLVGQYFNSLKEVEKAISPYLKK